MVRVASLQGHLLLYTLLRALSVAVLAVLVIPKCNKFTALAHRILL